ncbi:MAG: sensor histidine kinase [Bacteroidaceae bacterium]
MDRNERNFRILEIAIHPLTWMLFFFFPQKFFVREDGFTDTLSHVEPFLFSLAILMVGFYINYLWLVPQMLKSRNIWRLTLINLVLFFVFQFGGVLWDCTARAFHEESFLTQMEQLGSGLSLHTEEPEKYVSEDSTSSSDEIVYSCNIEDSCYEHGFPSIRRKESLPELKGFLTLIGLAIPNQLTPWITLFRNFLVYTLMVLLSVVLRMAFRFRKEELARKQAELRQTETELQSLKNQISPHFLLNTLNNIYALVMMDQSKAQEAIINLSRLLSRMLYHGSDTYVKYEREIDFLRSYVELMQLRISPRVKVEFNVDVGDCGQMPIAPYILVTLVENAFKHGIHGNQGYIHVHIQASKESGIIYAEIRNSNYPKSHDDKSGHGVGLSQVQRRLDLVYPGRYVWETGVNPECNEYYSILTIQTR